MKDTVLFDLGGTLVRYYTHQEFPPILGRCVAEVRGLLARRGLLRLDPEAIAERVAAEDHEDPGLRVRPLEERLIRIFDLDEVLEGPRFMGDLCRRFMGPIFQTARVYDDAVPVLRDLRAEGLRTGLVSNTPWGCPADLWREDLGRLGLAGLFDAVVFCRDAGWRKPAREIFDFALRALAAGPEQCLFVGDDPRWDTHGARAAGMSAVLIDRDGAEHPPHETVIAGLRGLWTQLRLPEIAKDEEPGE